MVYARTSSLFHPFSFLKTQISKKRLHKYCAREKCLSYIIEMLTLVYTVSSPLFSRGISLFSLCSACASERERVERFGDLECLGPASYARERYECKRKSDPRKCAINSLILNEVITFYIRYGDKTPRTFLGRMYGVIWILVGAVMLSLFTALFTNAMQGALDGTRCQDMNSKDVSC